MRVPTTDPPVRSQVVLLEAARRAAQIRVVEPVIRHAAAPIVGGEAIRVAAV